MKTILYTLGVILASVLNSNANNTKTEIPSVSIEISEDNQNEFRITNPEVLKQMIVSVVEENEETIYTVESNQLKATYVLNDFGFGLRMKRNVINEMKDKGLLEQFNISQLQQQSILCESTSISKKECLNIIAHFFPLLIE